MTARWNIDTSGRCIQRNGAPWFLVGDTAWELLHRLTEQEAEHYLRTRARQGFNTVLTVGISEFDGLREPNSAGHTPFHDMDPGRPNTAYWQHADRIIRMANSLGLTVGLLPTWGTHWCDAEPGGAPFFNPITAAAYGSWIAHRYCENDVIWVLGGDRNISTEEHRNTVDAFASGLREVIGSRQLITFHPRGHASSSDSLADAAWLDFDMIQSGHTGWNTPNYQLIEQDYRRFTRRPVLDGEPNYENHPVMTPATKATGTWEAVPDWRFDDRDVRRAAYHSAFSGACGHVYGCHDVWQFFDPDRTVPINGARTPWKSALDLPGADQMGHLAALVKEIGLLDWEPDQSILASGAGFLGSHQRAMSGDPGVVIYVPGGHDVRLDLSHRPGRTWAARWWDPVEGRWLAQVKRFAGDRFAVSSTLADDGVVLVESL